MEIDVGQLFSAVAGGGGVWLAIRAEIRLLWRECDQIRHDVEKLENKIKV